MAGEQEKMNELVGISTLHKTLGFLTVHDNVKQQQNKYTSPSEYTDLNRLDLLNHSIQSMSNHVPPHSRLTECMFMSQLDGVPAPGFTLPH